MQQRPAWNYVFFYVVDYSQAGRKILLACFRNVLKRPTHNRRATRWTYLHTSPCPKSSQDGRGRYRQRSWCFRCGHKTAAVTHTHTRGWPLVRFFLFCSLSHTAAAGHRRIVAVGRSVFSWPCSGTYQQSQNRKRFLSRFCRNQVLPGCIYIYIYVFAIVYGGMYSYTFSRHARTAQPRESPWHPSRKVKISEVLAINGLFVLP